jgi:diguanylate cyclase (GGDEF)-like protein/PAS domain S-box-containing protein
MAAFTDETFYRTLLDNIDDGVYFVDRDLRITFWNRGAERLTGYAAPEVVGSSCADGILEHVDTTGGQLCGNGCPLGAIIAGEVEVCDAEVFLHHRDGHRLPVRLHAAAIKGSNGAVIGAVEVFSDNSSTVSYRDLIDELKRLALLDPLTGIANRRFLEMKLAQAAIDHDRHGIGYGVMMLDIDHFKRVNDTYGHGVGDRVLTMVAETMRPNIRSTDLVARYGGEEFMVVVSHLSPEGLFSLAEKLRLLIATSFLSVEGERLAVTVSIGATMVHAGEKGADLVARADRLLYRAKEAGRNRVMVE